MDQQRGRSPSQGAHIRQSHSPSPHLPYSSNLSSLGIAHSLSPPAQPFDITATPPAPTAGFETLNQPFLAADHQSPPQFPSQDSNSYLHAQQSHRSPSPSFSQDQQSNLFAAPGSDPALFDSNNTINPSFLNELDPNNNSYLDPALLNQSLMNQMATTQAHSPTPPHLLVQPDMHRASSTSPHHSPNMNQGGFTVPSQHSRHASLDPNSAAYPQGQQVNEWNNMYRGHRRTPSDAYSDVSSSAHPSPYLGNTEQFNENPSPLLSAQQDPAMFQEVMNFGHFSLNENGSRHASPAHSPHISPRLPPSQQHLPPFTAADNFGLTTNQFSPHQGLGVYPQNQVGDNYQGAESFPDMAHNPVDMGQADQMSPPEINIDFAPPSRQPSFEPPRPDGAENALSPPDRSRSRNRIRAKSDPYASVSRASSPGSEMQNANNLSPHTASRSSSRSPPPHDRAKAGTRRSSTSSIPNRDYILDLADPQRPGSAASTGEPGSNNSKRTQKHPATFQCTLCPKRFTRAYNLRSHLRTHTDERPFVCSVCGKAFARQHDRKRHEGLHSGEKKFVCRGVLKDNGNWGCGRRFARADALGRHFRSEAGRVCIRPLLEEEAAEKGWEAQQQAAQMQGGMNGGMGIHPVGAMPGFAGAGGMMAQSGFEAYPGAGMPATSGADMAMSQPTYGLPAALLAQYPALATMNWDALPPGPPPEEGMEGDISGRSSFDASSGGEYYDEEEDSGGYQPVHAAANHFDYTVQTPQFGETR